MRDWKFIQVGNETVGPNWDKKRQLEDELRGWMTMVNKLDGDERRNAEKQIADIRKELNDVKIRIAHGENKKAGNEGATVKISLFKSPSNHSWIPGINDRMIEGSPEFKGAWGKDEALKWTKEWAEKHGLKVGNESIDKQEWSMFKGLTKKAEEEVGNDESDLIKRGFVYKVIIPGKKPIYFNNPRQAQIAAEAQKGTVEKVGNKVGNEDIPTEQDLKNWIRMSQQDMKDAQREMEKNKPLGHPDSYREENYGRAKVKYDEAAKAIKKMEEELRQGKYKKVGNARSKEQLLADVRELTKYIKDNPDRPCEKEKRLLGEAKEELDKRYGVIVWNSLPHDYHNRYPSDPIYADMKSSAQLESIKKEPWRVYDIMGVGDSIARERVFEMIEEKYGIDYNDIYEAWLGKSWDKAVQKKSFDEAKKLAQKLGLRFGNKTGNADTVSEYNAEIQRLTKKAEQLRRMGQGRSAMEIEKQIEKLGRELREIGNSKYGSKEDIISHLDTDLYDIHKNMGGKDRPIFFYVSELQKKGYDIGTISKFIKDIGKTVERLKTGNETLGQWAKAKPRIINGLKRARNAMAKNAMSVSDLERRIKENEKYIKSLQGKTVDGEGWPAKDAIQEAQDEIDMMKSRIAELTKQGNKKVCNLDTVEEGDYVTVRFQGELVDGVVRKVQGTQALVTIDNTDVWFPIRSLKEST